MTGAKSGEYPRFLSFHGRNPDVLNSIANLSNDEVFTPPEFANKMLDTLEKAWAESNNGENIWSNPDLKFLDPFTKSGVFLREIASRLIKGLESEIPDLQDRVDHILTKQVFGIATTHLTSLMARRSLYCSKKANGKHSVTKKFKEESGNIWFEPLPHTWGKGTVRELTMDESGNEVERFVDGKCKYCGASKRDFDREEGLELHAYGLIHTDDPKKWIGEIFGSEMRFDVIIGNPPYQLSDGGNGASASPIYQHFIDRAKKLEPRFISMVVPARWYAGGKGLDSFRDSMIRDRGISRLEDFPDSRDCFPQVDIAGGICYFLWDSQHVGPCEVATNKNQARSVSVRNLLEHGLDIFLREKESLSILEKIRDREIERGASTGELALPAELRFSTQVSARKPFGLPTNAEVTKSKPAGEHVEVMSSSGRGWVKASSLTGGRELLNKWLVYTSKASHDHAGQPDKEGTRRVLSRLGVLPPGVAVTESYILLGAFDSKVEADACRDYAATRFFRYLVSLRANTQDITKSRFDFVPILPSGPVTDESLFAHYGLNESEVEHVTSRIRAMETDSE